MFAALMPYKTLLEALAFAALIAGIAFGVHRFLSHEQDIGYQRAVTEYQAKQLAAEQAARAREQALQNQLKEAQDAAATREKTIQDAASAASVAAGSLRDTLANIRNRLPATAVDACRKTADTLAAVLGQCQDRYRDLAQRADGHASDVKTLTDSWPR